MSAQSNKVLKQLFKQDQQHRQGRGLAELQTHPQLWSAIQQQDQQRRQAVLAMIEQSRLTTTGDFWRASVIMQHGQDLSDYRLAYELATKGLQLGQPPMNTIVARATDKYLLKRQQDAGLSQDQQTQLFGTNFQTDPQLHISYVYSTSQTIAQHIIDSFGLIDISPFIDQPVSVFYQAQDAATRQAFTNWQNQSKAAQQQISADIIEFTQTSLQLD